MRCNHLAGLTFACALIGPGITAHSQGTKPLPGQKYALLVGVRQYDPNELRSLPYSESDVVELAEVLKDAGYRQVVTLTQTAGSLNARLSPTAANVRTTLKGMLQDRGTGDTILVAFAGHGVQFRGSSDDFFCPMDARLANRFSLVSLREVYKDLESCGAGVKVLLVDACRNDPQSDNSRSRSLVRLESVTRPQQSRPPGGVAALFSCSPGERAFEHDRLKHGVFFHFVIRGLKGEADLDRDGAVGVEELALYTKSNVPDFVKEEYGFDVRQMPVLRGEVGGLTTLVDLRGAEGPGAAAPGSNKAGEAGAETASRSSPRPSASEAPKSITGAIGMKLVLIPSGEFAMGSLESDGGAHADEKPQHRVRITRPFYLGVTEVTQAEYQLVMGKNPSLFSAQGAFGGSVAGQDTREHPVENVGWDEAAAFCDKLSERQGLKPYYRSGENAQSSMEGYRLPTEAEWEYACRAGGQARYSFGDDAARLGDYAWFAGNAADKTHPVGQKRANALGLYGMHGNVCEWCRDGYDSEYYRASSAANPSGPSLTTDRVFRGGSWASDARSSRSANRNGGAPGDRYGYLGFRVARSQTSR
jgi:formylglycine-generating enzyme required for sulfatase activity